MKAAICHQFGEPLVVEEVELASPQAGEVAVKLSACAICHSDIHYMEGAWGGELPAVYGHEAAGVVQAAGKGVTRPKPGDHVVVTLIRSCGTCYYCTQGHPYLCQTPFPLDTRSPLRTRNGVSLHQGMRTGAFAESVVVDQSQVVPIPHEVPLDCASLLACGVITGLGAVINTAQVPAGSNVVVIGCGGVGLNSIQGAALCGAQTIIALDLLDKKLQAAEAFGATHTINPLKANAQEQIYDLTQGYGADYVFVTVGSGKAMEQGLRLLHRAGTLVVVGMPPYGVKLLIETADFASTGQRILASKMGSTRPNQDIPHLVALYQQGRLKLDELITGRYPLGEINRAITVVKQGNALRNVIVF
jgi:Zn-dependent alcohol dehydrogenase